MLRHHLSEAFSAQKRRVATGHEDRDALGFGDVLLEHLQRRAHSVAGAELFFLEHKLDRIVEHFFYLVGTMSDHNILILDLRLAGRLKNATEHWLSENAMQHLRHLRTHSGAFSGSENDCVLIHPNLHDTNLFHSLLYQRAPPAQ